ncbi:hypothetical protein D1872_260900 [compost metagenome]
MQQRAVQRLVDLQGPAQFAGAPRQVHGPARAGAAAGAHERLVARRERLHRPDQDGLRIVRRAGDHVQAVVHAVDQVDVSGPALAEHNLGAGGPAAAVGVAALVLDAAVALRLDDPAADRPLHGLPDKDLSEEPGRRFQGGDGIKR